MRVAARFMRWVGTALTAVTLVSAIPVTAGSTATTYASHSDVTAITQAKAVNNGTARKSQVVPAQAYDNCTPAPLYCDYNQTNGNDGCFSVSPPAGAVPNWDDIGFEGSSCRNLDESFANRYGESIRLSYSPNYKGAWACVNNGWYSNNLNMDAYTFNSGPGHAGYHQKIWKNVASSRPASGGCSNPLPEDG
jgi:hypothetical protein